MTSLYFGANNVPCTAANCCLCLCIRPLSCLRGVLRCVAGCCPCCGICCGALVDCFSPDPTKLYVGGGRGADDAQEEEEGAAPMVAAATKPPPKKPPKAPVPVEITRQFFVL